MDSVCVEQASVLLATVADWCTRKGSSCHFITVDMYAGIRLTKRPRFKSRYGQFFRKGPSWWDEPGETITDCDTFGNYHATGGDNPFQRNWVKSTVRKTLVGWTFKSHKSL